MFTNNNYSYNSYKVPYLESERNFDFQMTNQINKVESDVKLENFTKQENSTIGLKDLIQDNLDILNDTNLEVEMDANSDHNESENESQIEECFGTHDVDPKEFFEMIEKRKQFINSKLKNCSNELRVLKDLRFTPV